MSGKEDNILEEAVEYAADQPVQPEQTDGAEDCAVTATPDNPPAPPALLPDADATADADAAEDTNEPSGEAEPDDADNTPDTENSEAASAGAAQDTESGNDESAEADTEDGDEFELPLEQVVEALLFSANEPVKIEKLAKSAGRGVRRERVREIIDELNKFYEANNRAFEIVEIADKFQLMSRAEFARPIQRFYGKKAVREESAGKLTAAALDTLAIIAYKQPVTRADVEAVRGVGCGQLMRFLMERGSIRPVGKRMDVIGYPLLYGTTEAFLQEFGLPSLEQLPMLEQMRRLTGSDTPLPDPEAREQQQSLLVTDDDAEDDTDEALDDSVEDDSVEDDEDSDDEDSDDEDSDDEDSDDEDSDDEDSDDEDSDDEESEEEDEYACAEDEGGQR